MDTDRIEQCKQAIQYLERTIERREDLDEKFNGDIKNGNKRSKPRSPVNH